mmetsp:Transcript_6882/g.41981  ORF Transcript_6882/g.41981 Transcript_6882/m.41981 type:complete len:118 (-) Transcript_6882:1186-1539(-)
MGKRGQCILVRLIEDVRTAFLRSDIARSPSGKEKRYSSHFYRTYPSTFCLVAHCSSFLLSAAPVMNGGPIVQLTKRLTANASSISNACAKRSYNVPCSIAMEEGNKASAVVKVTALW